MATPTFTGTADQVEAITGLPGFDSNTILTITDADYDVARLTTINAATNGKITLQKAAELLTGTLSDLETALTGIKYTGAIHVTDTTTANIDAALQLTTGKVTATVAGTAADLVEALTPSATAKDALTLTVAAGTVAAKDLITLDGKTSVAVDAATNTVVITGNATELKAIFKAATATTPTITLADTVAVKVTGTVSAADVNTLADATTGAVTADVTGSAAALNAALKATDTNDIITVTLTGTTAAAKDLKELDLKTTVDASSIKTITGDAADVISALANTTLADNVAATVTGTVTIANIATIKGIATTGVIKATVEDTATNLTGLISTSTDLLTLKITDAVASANDLITIDGKTSVKVDASAVTSITDTAANLKTIYASKTISGLGNEAVEITDAKPSAKDVNVILKATTGVVKATVEDTATNLVKTLTDAKATDNLTLKVTGTATAAELKALDAKTTNAVTASAVTEITGNAADVKTVLAADGINKAADVDVKVTGTVSAADANIIADATTGKVTATVTAGTAADLNAKLIDADGTPVTGDALTLTVNGKTAAATDLNDLDGKTLVDVKVDATEVTGNFTDLYKVYETNKANFANLGNETVKITDTVSAADANKIANATTGKVTATVTADTAANLVGALGAAAATDALTLTVNATATAASDLILLDGKTSVDVIVNATSVDGTFAELNKVYVANKANFAALGDEAVTINDTTVTAAQANTIANATTGVVTAIVADATAASLNAALKNAVATDALTLTVNGATATAADLNALDGKTDKVITVDAKAVTGTFDGLNKVFVTNEAHFTGEETVAVKITDTVSATNADIIADATSGIVTATITADTAAALNLALGDIGLQVNAYNLTVNGATALATDLNALDGKTSVDVKVDATKVTGDYVDLYKMYVTNKANFTALGNENIDITDTNSDLTAAQVNTIASLTTGKVTATISDTAANLVAALTKSTGDALSLIVNGATAKAADLITLDGKTALDVTVSATAVTGTYAELYKVYQTNALNFIGLGTQNVTITDKVTVDQINTIKELITTGHITAAVSGSAADLAKLNTAGAGGDAITLTVSGTTATAADLNTLDLKTSVPVNAASVTTITSDAANVAGVLTAYTANTNGTITGLGNEAVTVSGTVSASDANTIAGKTSGIVTATVTADTAANLNPALANAVATDALTLTVNGATATAANLNALDGKTSVAVKVDATAVEGTYSDLSKVYVTNKANFTGLGNETVTISYSVSAAQANTIANATTGVVTATVADATAATLNAALTDTTLNAYSLKLTDTNLNSLTNLLALNGKTSTAVDATTVTTISETFDKVDALYKATHISNLGNKAVTITDTQSAANVDSIADKIGTAVVTATVTADTATALNAALNDSGSEVNAYSLKITDTNLSSLTNLLALNGKTSAAVDATTVTTISETFTNVDALYKATHISNLGNEAVTITDTQSAANVDSIANATTGVVTAALEIGTEISDATVTALNHVNAADVISLASNVTIADASALVALAAKVDTLTVASVTKITEAFDTATLTTVVLAAEALKAGANVEITGGTISATDLGTLASDATIGNITATLAANTAITDAIVSTTLTAVNSSDVISLTSTVTTADATALVALADKVATADVTAFASVTTITEDAASIGTNGATVVSALTIAGGNDAATINGAISDTSATAINGATTGLVTVSEIDVTGTTFSLAGLASLSDGITGLETIDAAKSTTESALTLNFADLLLGDKGAAASIIVKLGAGDTLAVDATAGALGWTSTVVDATHKTYAHSSDTGSTTDYTINVVISA